MDPVADAKVGARHPDFRVRVRCSSLNSFLIRSKNRMKNSPPSNLCGAFKKGDSSDSYLI
jgi:hypothetical protein